MEAVWLGDVAYGRALGIQLDYVEKRARGEVPDTLLLLTHPHVYTFGRTGDPKNLLVSPESLAREGIAVARIGRGGDVTYHGPGQLVGYPIVHLAKPDVHRYVRAIEAALVEALGIVGVPARRVDGLTGVWSGEKKIASIGVGVRRWVAYHGFALNVCTDLSYFKRIHLCGLVGREATSITEAVGREVTVGEVRDVVAASCDRHIRGFS